MTATRREAATTGSRPSATTGEGVNDGRGGTEGSRVNGPSEQPGGGTSTARPPVTPARIALHAAHHFGLTVSDLRTSSTHRAATARHVAMFLCRDLLGMSFPQIGRHFDRDHSTVLGAVRALEVRIRHSAATAAHVEAVVDRLTADPLAVTLDATPLLRLVRKPLDCDPDTRRAYYRAARTGRVSHYAADLLAVELLGLHPILVYGDAWLGGAAA